MPLEGKALYNLVVDKEKKRTVCISETESKYCNLQLKGTREMFIFLKLTVVLQLNNSTKVSLPLK